MPGETQFRTYQTVDRYEEALNRHKQWVRWTRSVPCACLNQQTRQPNPKCTNCYGRGQIYRTPGPQAIINERVKHDYHGRCYIKYPPFSGTPQIFLRGATLPLGSQPADKSYIQLAAPYPREYEPLYANYLYNPINYVVAEDSEVVASNTLRVIAPRFTDIGKDFEGSLDGVSRVYNKTKLETYTVSSFGKEYIYLSDMGTYAGTDVLEVDYSYVEPFPFMLIQVSMKMRYERAYVLEDADAVLITPYWAKTSPQDLFTALAAEQYGSAVIDPTHSVGNDVVSNYYDLARLMEVIDADGIVYTVGVGNNVELFGRNELKWNIAKPRVRYTATFHYHPTYVALHNVPTLRTSENKSFVNRVSVKLRDKIDERNF